MLGIGLQPKGQANQAEIANYWKIDFYEVKE
jgi:hypothetical protein